MGGAAEAPVRLADLHLTIGVRHGARSALQALAVGIGVGLAMLAADAVLFQAYVPAAQRDAFAGVSYAARLGWFIPRALLDEAVLRLAALWPLLWLVARLRGRADAVGAWLAIALVAVVVYPLYAHAYFAGLAWSPGTAARELLLHGGAGIAWGALNWRHGWSAGALGHCAAHLVLQAPV